MKPIHPFPARMAPELALASLVALRRGSIILDPMSGSGMVLRQAAELGHRAMGFDIDPLAVIMSRVWNTRVNQSLIIDVYCELKDFINKSDDLIYFRSIDSETRGFIEYWFGWRQIRQLSAIAGALIALNPSGDPVLDAALDVLRLALSRIIVTKEQVASLARDTSHSRPHKVAEDSEYDVFDGFERSVRSTVDRLTRWPPPDGVTVGRGDARSLVGIKDNSIDAVVTSPPYLNAIDYLRGHRLALVWFNWSVSALRDIRGNSIGAERALAENDADAEQIEDIYRAMVDAPISSRHSGMIRRFARDMRGMASEVNRVLNEEGAATFVIGNSCLKGTFVRSADGVAVAAGHFGLREISRIERDLPTASRYLPVTGANLTKRMRTETVLTFRRQ